MKHALNLETTNKEAQRHLLGAYIIGFILSLALTVLAYALVVNRDMFGNSAFVLGAIVALALLQFLAQLVFFLHVGTEARAKWKILAFVFMVGTVLILVVGSLWIMDNLNYHMQSDQQEVKEYLEKHDSL